MGIRGSAGTRALLRGLGAATYPLSRMGVGRSRLVRSGWRLFARGLVGEVATVNIEGLSLQILSRDLFAMNVLLRGGWETYELRLFRDSVRRGMTVVDVGAHVGLYSLVAARALAGGGRVVAFEPEPTNYSLLLRNIDANGFANVAAVQKAVADRSGTLELFLDSAHSTLHSLRPPAEGRSSSILVEVTSLDGHFGGERVDVIKMDVEGVEGGVLDGMRGLIERNPQLKLFTEFNPAFLRAAGTDPEAFLRKLTGFGFSLFEISTPKRRLVPLDTDRASGIPPGEGIDLLCTR